MLSFRARLFLWLLNIHRNRQKGINGETVFDMATSIPEFRESVRHSSKFFGRLPKGMTSVRDTVNTVPGEWIAPTTKDSNRMILYFHGGGYVSGAAEFHRSHVSRFVWASGHPAFVFDYRLAPEHPFPAALEDAVSVYRGILDRGYLPDRVVFAGDSAGAGLCLAALLALKDRGLPQPSGAVALSPWTDLACTGESFNKNASTCLSPKDSWHVFSRHYCGDADPKHHLISPLYGDPKGLPPLLIFAGSREVMLDDAERFAGKAKGTGVDVTLEIGKGLFHCYPVCGAFFPESQKAIKKIGAFIRNCLN